MSILNPTTTAKSNITAGTGVTIDGNAISVDTPVQGIYTQEEFDALPEEQRSKGMYIIDNGQTGSSGGTSMEIYDDEERVIGTWFGKPLYRKTGYGAIPNNISNGVWTKVFDLAIDLNTVVVKFDATLVTANGSEAVVFAMESANDYFYFAYSRDSSAVRVYQRGFATKFNGRILNASVYYTKTTDPEVSP